MTTDKSKQYSLLIGGSSSLGTVVASEFVSHGELTTRENLTKISYDFCQPHLCHLNGACIDINGGIYVQ